MSLTDTPTNEPVEAPRVEGNLPRQDALDGLRGVAILAVMVYHAFSFQPVLGASWAPGGFLGVDVFFVLSGFLITGILLGDHARSGSTLSRRFWYRRSRRLLPAALLMLVILSAYAVFRAQPWDLFAIRSRGIAALFYVENWYAIIARPAPAPVSHVWSLSVEEQWYVIWPLLLGGLLLLLRDARRTLIGVMLLLTVASALLMEHYGMQGNNTVAYQSTLSRAGELLLGGVLAFAVRRRPVLTSRRGRIAAELAGVAGLAWVLWCVFAIEDTDARWLYRGGLYSIAVATMFVILAALQPTSPVMRRMLAWRPLVAVGLISYGLYLFHIPIYAWIDHRYTGLGPYALTALRFAVVGVVAVASYHLLEQPFRHGAFRGRGHWLALGGTAAVLALLVGATAGAHAAPRWQVLQFIFSDASARVAPETPKLLVVGENDGLSLAAHDPQGTVTDGVAIASVATVDCAVGGDRPLLGTLPGPRPTCDPWFDTIRAGLSFEPDATILMVGTTAMFDHRAEGRDLRVGDPAYAKRLQHRLDRAAAMLTKGGHPLAITTVTCPGVPTNDTSAVATVLRDPARRAWVNGVWRTWAAQHPDVRVVDLDPLLCPNGTTPAGGPNGPYRAADGALTSAGIAALRSWLAQQSGLIPR